MVIALKELAQAPSVGIMAFAPLVRPGPAQIRLLVEIVDRQVHYREPQSGDHQGEMVRIMVGYLDMVEGWEDGEDRDQGIGGAVQRAPEFRL